LKILKDFFHRVVVKRFEVFGAKKPLEPAGR
jgi:hypothetical protein